MTLIVSLKLSLLLWFAGLQTITPPAASSAVSPLFCIEPPTPVQGANGGYAGPVCASIQGVVVRAGSSVGIANARVTLEFPNSGAHADELKTVADAEGRFSFSSIQPILPPDGYNLTAEADGYLHTAYGQIGNNASGELINFPGGQQKRLQLTIKLNPSPTASGSVHTTDFQPIAAAVVRSYRIHYTPIGRRLKIDRTTLTTDLGAYRIVWIEPADYYVSASYSERARERPISGALLTPNLSNPDSGFVTSFYATGISSAEGTAFTVAPTGEKSNLDITLKETDRYTLHVHAFSKSTLQLQHFNVALLPAGADLGDVPDYTVEGKDGVDFDIPGVGPGRYSLVAFDKSRILSEAVPVTVDRESEVKIPIYDPLDIPGIVTDEFNNPIAGKMRVRLVRTDPELGQTVFADVESGSFVVPDLGPASYDVYVDGLPQGIYIKDVRFPVSDNKFGRIRIEPDKPPRVMDPATLRWKSEPAIQVIVALAGGIAEGTVWTGTKTNKGPEGIAGAQVVLVPDRSPTNPYALREDRFITGNTDANGHFRLPGVPPGSYSAFGFVEIQPGLYYDPQFNDRISDLGVKLTIMGNETFKMTFCETAPGRYDSVCLLRVPREQSYGVAP